jgi:hypothetical protein
MERAGDQQNLSLWIVALATEGEKTCCAGQLRHLRWARLSGWGAPCCYASEHTLAVRVQDRGNRTPPKPTPFWLDFPGTQYFSI